MWYRQLKSPASFDQFYFVYVYFVEWNKTSCPDLSALSWIDEYMHLAKENIFANLKTLEIPSVLSHKKQK